MVLCTNLNLKQSNSIDSRSRIKGKLAPFFMSIETTVLDFKLSNTFEEYEAHMNRGGQTNALLFF